MDKLLQLKDAVKGAVLTDPLTQFRLSEVSRQGGHQRLVKLIDATEKSSGGAVTVHICNCATVEERCGGNTAEAHQVMQRIRDGVHVMTRLRHPSILRVVLPLTEDKPRHRFVWATERSEKSLDGLLQEQSALRSDDLLLSKVEAVYGLVQVGRVLDFLHSKAGVLMLQFSPHSIVITPSGDWKIGDMTYAAAYPQSLENEALRHAFPPLSTGGFLSLAAPRLDYCAPEVVDYFVSEATAPKSGGAMSAKHSELLPDLFSDFHVAPNANGSSNNSKGGPGDTRRKDIPLYPDSDVYSFVATAAAVIERRQLINSGGETTIYRRQQSDANAMIQRLFPSWGTIASVPRPSITQLLATECFACREVQLLSQLPALESLEPRDKLQILKGLYDEVMKSSFPVKVLHRTIIPALLQSTADERMIKFVLPIILEACSAFEPPLCHGMFNEKLRPFLEGALNRAVKGASASAPADELSTVILHQCVEKFAKFFRHFTSVKDLQGLLVPLVSCGVRSPKKEVVSLSLSAIRTLLCANERSFCDGDSAAADVLTAVMVCPEEAAVAISCLQKLLPVTTKCGREDILEPKLISGLTQVCKSGGPSAGEDVEQLLKVFVSIVSGSTVEHIANVTLPLLCPLLVINHVTVRHHISQYVTHLVNLVVRKKEDEERDAELKKKEVVRSSGIAIATTRLSELPAAKHVDSSVSSDVSFFAKGVTSQPTAPQVTHQSARNDEINDVFGF